MPTSNIIVVVVVVNLTLLEPKAMQVSYLSLKLRKTLLRVAG